MEHSVGDIIRGPGSRAPRYKIVKVSEKTLTVIDQCGQQRRFSKRLPWTKI